MMIYIRSFYRHFTIYRKNMAKFLKLNEKEYIAYHHVTGKHPGVVFLPGLMSHMNGTKALALESLCREIGYACTRFDYRGHGESSGKHEEATIGSRKEDVLTVLKRVATGRQIIVGSSLGGWIMLLVAMDKPQQVCGLVGIACATDFISRRYESLPEAVKTEIQTKGFWQFPSRYSEEPYVLKLEVIEEARHHKLGDEKIEICCPVRLLHGINDQDVPYTVSLDVCKQLQTSDVTVTFIKDGDHRLSDPKNLGIILKAVKELVLDTSQGL